MRYLLLSLLLLAGCEEVDDFHEMSRLESERLADDIRRANATAEPVQTHTQVIIMANPGEDVTAEVQRALRSYAPPVTVRVVARQSTRVPTRRYMSTSSYRTQADSITLADYEKNLRTGMADTLHAVECED